jgi:hypothetical protein
MKKPIKIVKVSNLVYFALLFLLLFAAVLYKQISNKRYLQKVKSEIIPAAVKQVINNPGIKFTIDNIKEESGVYEFELKMGEGNNAQKYVSYISKDGKLLFTSGIKMETLKNQAVQGSETEQKKLTCDDLTKVETPQLAAFVVSQCPYGLQMQRVFKKTVDELTALGVNLAVKYIGSVENGKITAMHGEEEATENLRQICIRDEQKDLYWSYVSCYMKEGKTDDCLAISGVNTYELSTCMEDQNRGLKYARADFDLANKYKVGGSPSLLLNGQEVVSEFDFGGRTPEAIKQIVCCSSKNKPEYCSQEISKDSVATGFSQTDEAAAGTESSAAGCGQ